MRTAPGCDKLLAALATSATPHVIRNGEREEGISKRTLLKYWRLCLFVQSGIQDLRETFFERFPDVEKWTVFSDYYFEEDRPNRVITFSIIPYVIEISRLKHFLKSLFPTDIKHASQIRQESLRRLRDVPIASIAFILPQNRYFAFANNEAFVRSMRASVSQMLTEQLPRWRRNRLQHQSIIARLKRSCGPWTKSFALTKRGRCSGN